MHVFKAKVINKAWIKGLFLLSSTDKMILKCKKYHLLLLQVYSASLFLALFWKSTSTDNIYSVSLPMLCKTTFHIVCRNPNTRSQEVFHYSSCWQRKEPPGSVSGCLLDTTAIYMVDWKCLDYSSCLSHTRLSEPIWTALLPTWKARQAPLWFLKAGNMLDRE